MSDASEREPSSSPAEPPASPARRPVTLMPEVLPTPTVTVSGDVRRRTLGHLQRVLIGSTATATLHAAAFAALQAGCELPSALPEPPGPPSTPPDRHGTEAPFVYHGYIVVDQLPPPPFGSGVAESTAVNATWQRDADGWYVQLDFGAPQRGSLSRSASVTSSNGTVLRVEPLEGGGLSVLWRPERDYQMGGALLIPASFRGVRQAIGVRLTMAAPSERVEGAAVDVLLLDTLR